MIFPTGRLSQVVSRSGGLMNQGILILMHFKIVCLLSCIVNIYIIISLMLKPIFDEGAWKEVNSIPRDTGPGTTTYHMTVGDLRDHESIPRDTGPGTTTYHTTVGDLRDHLYPGTPGQGPPHDC